MPDLGGFSELAYMANFLIEHSVIHSKIFSYKKLGQKVGDKLSQIWV